MKTTGTRGKTGWLLVSAGLALLGAAWVGLRGRDGGGESGAPEGVPARVARATPRLPAPKLPNRSRQRAERNGPAPANSLFGIAGNGIEVLTREQIDRYLSSRGRDAQSLIMASRMADDLSLLREAAERFPGDPRVQLELGLRGESSAERRKGLEACRALAPDNPLPDYLLAGDALREGRGDAAIEALVLARDKPALTDYSAEHAAEARDAYLFAGRSPLQAEVAGMYGVTFLHLGRMNELAKGMGDLQQAYRQAGDPESAEALGQAGVEMAARLSAQPGHYLLTDLVAMGIEKKMLEALPAETAVAAGGGTAGERLEALAVRREGLRDLGPTADRIFSLPEQQAVSYFERIRRDGEAAALQWLKGQAVGAVGP